MPDLQKAFVEGLRGFPPPVRSLLVAVLLVVLAAAAPTNGSRETVFGFTLNIGWVIDSGNVYVGEEVPVELRGPAGVPCTIEYVLPDGSKVIVEATEIPLDGSIRLRIVPAAGGPHVVEVSCGQDGDAFFQSVQFTVSET